MNSLFHRGIRGYASVLAALSFDPLSIHQLSERFGVNRQNMMDIVRGLHHHGMIHVSDWFKPGHHGGHWREVWSAGPSDDVPRPLGFRGRVVGSRRAPHTFRAELHHFSLLVQALEEGQSAPSLVELIGLGRDSTSLVIKHMKALQVIHIAAWESTRFGLPLPVYRMGLTMRDKPRPKPPTKREHNQRYWAGRTQRLKDRSMCQMMAAPLAQ